LQNKIYTSLPSRWIALKMLDGNKKILNSIEKNTSISFENLEEEKLQAMRILERNNIDSNSFKDMLVSSIMFEAEKLCSKAIKFEHTNYSNRDRKIDKILTSKIFGLPIMLLFLGTIFWLTIVGANYPSNLLSSMFNWFEEKLLIFFEFIHLPNFLKSMLIFGVYKTVTWVISVMLPPMAIFFPLFTLLEDLGYLPRIAFNLDKFFKKACTSGKQALTMCMGFGCNAAGVTRL